MTTSIQRATGVSVVIPTKNRAPLLVETLRSLREQAVPPARIVVADDGSTDETADVVQAFDVVYLREPEGGWGVSGGRNAGLAAVETDYVAFIDSDDLLHPRALEQLSSALDRQPEAPFAYGRALSAHRNGDGWRPESLITTHAAELEEPLCSLFARNSVHLSGAVARVAAVRAVGGYVPGIPFSEDHHLWIRLAQLGDPVHVDDLVSIYRHHTGNRNAPLKLLHGRAVFLALADEDRRLAGRQSGWRGTQLLESLAAARKAGDPLAALGALWSLLLSEPDKLDTLRAAVRHFRGRRARWAAGQRVWANDANLRGWLATFR